MQQQSACMPGGHLCPLPSSDSAFEDDLQLSEGVTAACFHLRDFRCGLLLRGRCETEAWNYLGPSFWAWVRPSNIRNCLIISPNGSCWCTYSIIPSLVNSIYYRAAQKKRQALVSVSYRNLKIRVLHCCLCTSDGNITLSEWHWKIAHSTKIQKNPR